jgi:hypothetical protein
LHHHENETKKNKDSIHPRCGVAPAVVGSVHPRGGRRYRRGGLGGMRRCITTRMKLKKIKLAHIPAKGMCLLQQGQATPKGGVGTNRVAWGGVSMHYHEDETKKNKASTHPRCGDAPAARRSVHPRGGRRHRQGGLRGCAVASPRG